MKAWVYKFIAHLLKLFSKFKDKTHGYEAISWVSLLIHTPSHAIRNLKLWKCFRVKPVCFMWMWARLHIEITFKKSTWPILNTLAVFPVYSNMTQKNADLHVYWGAVAWGRAYGRGAKLPSISSACVKMLCVFFNNNKPCYLHCPSFTVRCLSYK